MNKKLLIGVLIGSFLILICLAIAGYFCRNGQNFLDASLLDFINVGLTVIIGAILSIIIFCVTNNNEDFRRKKEIYHELLNRILNNFESNLVKPTSKNLDSFWVNCLSVKTNSECIINSFVFKNNDNQFKKTIEELSKIIALYFGFVEENLVTSMTNKKISDETIRLESKYRDDIINKTIDAICKLF